MSLPGSRADRLPDGKLPEVPQLEFGLVAPENRYVIKQLMECNWAQILEGDLDTSHFSFLHMPALGVPSNENPDAPADDGVPSAGGAPPRAARARAAPLRGA